MYEAVKASVQSDIDAAKSVCLTTDTWTSQNTTQSFLSLTAHWITDNFTRRFAVLHCELFEGSRTGARLADALTHMLADWKIDKTQVHIDLRDSGAYIVKALRNADLKNVSCFAHTLQLSLHDAVLSQQSVADLVSASRKLVGHFKHSSSATSCLHAIQEELGLPNHQLCQDVVTRWNATYTMLERLSEQKCAVCLFLSESDDVKGLGLTSYQWTLMGRVVSILQPFAQLTCEISSSTACLSLVLPAVQAILVFLQNDVCDTGVKKTESEIILALKNRFSQLFDEPLYIVSTGLDPRFKLQCISDEV